MKRRYPIVEVHWVDSSSYYGWTINSALEEVGTASLECLSAGFLMEETDDRVVLMLSYAPSSKGSVLTIPKVAITKMTVIRR